MSIIGDLLQIQEVGAERWLKEQKDEWRCPKCRGELCVMDREGYACGYEFDLKNKYAAMKLYSFITGPDDESFCKRVSEKLNNGWRLHGSPSLTFDGKSVIAGQAIVKEVDDEKYHPNIDLRTY